jgi:diacylglycerol kinase
MALEMINTSIEKICDMIDSNPNSQIKVIKDISSGAVLMFTIFTFFVGCIIFIPKLLMYI